MSTHKHRLILLKPESPTKAPPQELIQEALDLLVFNDQQWFARNVDAARVMWRKFPELVEAPIFPEQLRAALDEEPDLDLDMGERVLEPGHRESRLPDAVRIATHWMHEECEQSSGAKLLGKMGIAPGDPGSAS